MAAFPRQRCTLFFAFLFSATLFAGVSTSPASAQAVPEVTAMVSKFGNQVLRILASNETANQQKARFSSAFLHNADINAIARFTLGKYARKIKPAQRNKLQLLLGRYIVQLFVVKMRGTQSEGLEILGIVENKKGRDYLVKSVINIRKIPGYSDTPIPVKWRIKRNKNKALKLFDISIGGFWLAQEQRSTFVSLISRNNGNINALLDFLKKETGG